ncbi:MAG: hypothetical protein ACI9PP_000090 [Halobacteriales archaeon]
MAKKTDADRPTVRFRRWVLPLGIATTGMNTMTKGRYNRRTILAGMGAGALAITAGVSVVVTRGPQPYTKYTYAATQVEQEALRVAWYETYNGRPLESQGNDTAANVSETLDPDESPVYVDDVTGPVIELVDVLPGDSGRLHVGLEAVADDPVTITMSGSLDGNQENGVTEPELVAGDVTPDGELATSLEMTVWRDSGVETLGGFGACDGTQGPGEETIGTGTLETVLDEFENDVQLVDCLASQARTYCIGVDWNLPIETSNQIQSDEVAFTLAFTPSLCEEQ